jgi:hypothetical protein
MCLRYILKVYLQGIFAAMRSNAIPHPPKIDAQRAIKVLIDYSISIQAVAWMGHEMLGNRETHAAVKG